MIAERESLRKRVEFIDDYVEPGPARADRQRRRERSRSPGPRRPTTPVDPTPMFSPRTPSPDRRMPMARSSSQPISLARECRGTSAPRRLFRDRAPSPGRAAFNSPRPVTVPLPLPWSPPVIESSGHPTLRVLIPLSPSPPLAAIGRLLPVPGPFSLSYSPSDNLSPADSPPPPARTLIPTSPSPPESPVY